MRITDTNSTGQTASVHKKSAASGARFTLRSEGSADSASAVRSGAPAHAAGSLLALQAINDPGERRRQSVVFGHRLLDELDSLKVSLLSGAMTTAQIKDLVLLVENRPHSEAEKLERVISEIELRAKVELAKLSRAA